MPTRMATAGSGQKFTVEEAKAALQDILAAFQMPDNVLRLEEARDNAGNDMMKMMQIVFPVTTQIQMDVVQKYGFSGDGDGIIRFSQAVKMYEKQDAELAQLNAELQSIIMPQMLAPPAGIQTVAT